MKRSISMFNSNRAIAGLFALAGLISAGYPASSYPQTCAANRNGCLDVGALCSPVEVGRGNQGKCKTFGPRGETECDCVGERVLQNPAPFDLVADTTDDNGFPRNPKWGSQIPDSQFLPDPEWCPGRVSDPGSYP